MLLVFSFLLDATGSRGQRIARSNADSVRFATLGQYGIGSTLSFMAMNITWSAVQPETSARCPPVIGRRFVLADLRIRRSNARLNPKGRNFGTPTRHVECWRSYRLCWISLKSLFTGRVKLDSSIPRRSQGRQRLPEAREVDLHGGYLLGILLLAFLGGGIATVWNELDVKKVFYVGLGLPSLVQVVTLNGTPPPHAIHRAIDTPVVVAQNLPMPNRTVQFTFPPEVGDLSARFKIPGQQDVEVSVKNRDRVKVPDAALSVWLTATNAESDVLPLPLSSGESSITLRAEKNGWYGFLYALGVRVQPLKLVVDSPSSPLRELVLPAYFLEWQSLRIQNTRRGNDNSWAFDISLNGDSVCKLGDSQYDRTKAKVISLSHPPYFANLQSCHRQAPYTFAFGVTKRAVVMRSMEYSTCRDRFWKAHSSYGLVVRLLRSSLSVALSSANKVN